MVNARWVMETTVARFRCDPAAQVFRKKILQTVKRFQNYFQGCSLENEGIQSHNY